MKIFIFISFIIFYCSCCFNENENSLISALSKKLVVTHIIIVNRTCQILNKISELKYYSLKYINVAYMNSSELIKYLNSKHVLNVNLMIVLKVANNEELQSLSEQLSNKFEQIRVLSSFKWLLLLPQKMEIVVTEKNFYVPFDCQFFSAREIEKSYEIHEIYQIKKTTNMIYTYFGIWNKEHGLSVVSTYIYKNRKNMRRTPITISTKLIGDSCEFVVNCVHVQMMHDLADILNYTETFINISKIKKEKLDIAEQVTFLNYFNSKKDYVVGPFTVLKWHFYIKHELDRSHAWLSYLKPYSRALWLTTAFWLIIASIIKVVIARVAAKNEKLKEYTLLDQGFIPLTAFCNQAIYHGPHTTSSRIARISTFLVSGVMVPAYSAAVISSLTVLIDRIPFMDFDTFVQDGTYKLASRFHPVIVAMFKNSKNPVMQVIREKHLIPYKNFCLLHQDCVNMICENNKLSIAGFNYKLTQYPGDCRVFRIPKTILNLYTGIELSQGTRYKRILTDSLVQYRSSGILQRYHTIIYGEKNQHIEEEFQTIDISVVVFTFAVLLAGFILSCFVLLCEITWHKHYIHQQRQRQQRLFSLLPYCNNNNRLWKKSNG